MIFKEEFLHVILIDLKKRGYQKDKKPNKQSRFGQISKKQANHCSDRTCKLFNINPYSVHGPNEVVFYPLPLLDKEFASCTQSRRVRDFHFPLSLL